MPPHTLTATPSHPFTTTSAHPHHPAVRCPSTACKTTPCTHPFLHQAVLGVGAVLVRDARVDNLELGLQRNVDAAVPLAKKLLELIEGNQPAATHNHPPDLALEERAEDVAGGSYNGNVVVVVSTCGEPQGLTALLRVYRY